MSFTNYLEDENDKPYFTTNSLAYYYDKMEGFAEKVEGSAKALNLTKEEVEKRITLYIEQNKNELDQRLAQWDGKLETFDGSVENLLSEWVNDGTLTHVIDSTLIDQKIIETGKKTYSKTTGNTRPMVSFYLDDGHINDYNIVLPFTSSRTRPVPLTIALLNGMNSNKMTIAQLKELRDTHGWELQSHTATHPHLNELSYEEQLADMKANVDYYKGFDIELKGICYPYGDKNADSLKAARQLFRSANGSIPGINRSPINTYDLFRVGADSFDLNYMKQKVTEMGDDGWLIIYSHSAAFTTEPAKKQLFFDIIDYVVGRPEIDIVTFEEALDSFENKLDIGDSGFGEKYFKVGHDGFVDSSSIPTVKGKPVQAVQNRKVSTYQAGKLTIDSYTSTNKSDLSMGSGVGTLYTDRMNDNVFSYNANQTFYATDGGVFVRRAVSDTVWEDWTTMNSFNTVRKPTTYTNDAAITVYPKGKLTHAVTYAADNNSIPYGSGSGTLITSRLSDNDILNYQIFQPFNANSFYKRIWTAAGWGLWGKHSTTLYHSATVDFGEVAAGGTVQFDVPIAGVGAADVAHVNFRSGVIAGVIPYCYIGAADTVTIRVSNMTTTPKLVGGRPLVFSIVKA